MRDRGQRERKWEPVDKVKTAPTQIEGAAHVEIKRQKIEGSAKKKRAGPKAVGSDDGPTDTQQARPRKHKRQSMMIIFGRGSPPSRSVIIFVSSIGFLGSFCRSSDKKCVDLGRPQTACAACRHCF